MSRFVSCPLIYRTTHISILYYLHNVLFTFLLKTADVLISYWTESKVYDYVTILATEYHNSMVATVSPGWLCKHTISATIYIRFLEPQQERSSSRAMSECNVSIMFLTTLMYSYFCDHNVFNLWLLAVGLQILCK